MGDDTTTQYYNEIGQHLQLYIGTRRAGRPPICWSHFDAILNVTDVEYDDMYDSCIPSPPSPTTSDHSDPTTTTTTTTTTKQQRYYLQLPVREGKRDRTELEKYLTLGILFIVVHTKHANRNVLIHCAQGMDRSVALVIAVLALFSTNTYPLQWNDHYHNFPISDLVISEQDDWNNNDTGKRNVSGLSHEVLQSMLGHEGRDWLLHRIWPHPQQQQQYFITKESIRITLQLIQQQYHERAHPRRDTMQKLHRYFCSRSNETF